MLIDSAGLLILLDGADRRHEMARREFRRARKPFTHAYVLAELVPLARSRGIAREPMLGFISTMLEGGRIEIIWVDRILHERAHQLLLARLDKGYSLCDAVSFVLMRQRNEREAFTTDHHFEQEGFIRLLPG